MVSLVVYRNSYKITDTVFQEQRSRAALVSDTELYFYKK